MQFIQWMVATGTATFVALAGFFQWRTAQHKAVLDLFDRRHEIYEVVRKTVGQVCRDTQGIDQAMENEYLAAMEKAFFFFGEDINEYLKQLWNDIGSVRALHESARNSIAISLGRSEMHRAQAREPFERVQGFYTEGQQKFAKYMRFDQTVPRTRLLRWPWLPHAPEDYRDATSMRARANHAATFAAFRLAQPANGIANPGQCPSKRRLQHEL